jgi:hypothetical protein
MRLRIVSSRSEISNLRPNERLIHLAFRASNVDFVNLMQKCPRLRMIQVPHSYYRTMSDAILVFLEMQGIELIEGDVWGHRKDLDEYFVVEDEILDEILQMSSAGIGLEDLTLEIQKKARLSHDLIEYIIKNKATA